MSRAIAVWGTGSNVGKSLLVTALARWYRRQGFRVAPFKGQNMSNHARVAEGGEMGAAQYYQALAAGAVPEVRMNPVLLKPEGERQSQVVVLGQADLELSRMPWRERKVRLWPVVRESLAALMAEYDLLLIEGAGSPAEINLIDADIVNLRVAREAGAPVLLVADIDRGGAFAHIYGTWALLPDKGRSLLRAFVLNKFRGDPDLLAPAPETIWQRTGLYPLGVLPMLRHRLPEEDAATLGAQTGIKGGPRVAVVAYPFASNLDEFWPLGDLARLRLARVPDDLDDADLVVLPGSKNVGASLAWLFESGMDEAVRAKAGQGIPVLGICGGMQILGQEIVDPFGVEFGGRARGLGLLPIATELDLKKRVKRRVVRFGQVEGFFAPLGGMEFLGYEIHHGKTVAHKASAVLPEGLGFQKGNVLGVYLHGLFENPGVQTALFGRAAKGLDSTFDALADAVEAHLDRAFLLELAERGLGARRPVNPRKVFFLGGARSGKSQRAQALARRLGGDAVSLIVTARVEDEEMRERVRAHQRQRPASWEVLEAPRGAASAVRAAKHRVVLLDCLALLVASALLDEGEAAARAEVEALVGAIRDTAKTVIVVSNEVGMGVVPAYPLGRRYRDLLGWANQRLMDVVSEGYLVVAGRTVPLKGGWDDV